MSKRVYSLAGFTGGLELDIRDSHGDIDVICLKVSRDYSKPIRRLISIVLQLLTIRDKAPVLSAGGPVELIAALIFATIRTCHIYTPGTPEKYYGAISIALRLSKKNAKINTCDIGFYKRFPCARLYNNNPFKNSASKESFGGDDGDIKEYDAIIIGRCDKNKRFQ